MNILLYRWGAYTESDLETELKKLGNNVDVFIYKLEDKHHDEVFEEKLGKLIGGIDVVFSVNFFPVISKVCYANNIKYISWSYDAPLNVTNIEETLGLSCNYVFMFDRDQVMKYTNKGFDNVYHMPLAVPVERYSKLLNSQSEKQYNADISFVGNLYSDILSAYISPLTQYMQGFIKGMCAGQEQLYGCYLLDELIDDEMVTNINKRYKEVAPDTDIVMSKEALTYAMASAITREERLTILGLISSKYGLTYYSGEKSEVLKNAIYGGTCDYYSEMPHIFANSRINLNITLKALSSGIPLRALDIMGCRGFLLSNYQPELAESFDDGKEVVLYESIEDAFAKVDYYLSHENERLSICQKGYEKVRAEFNYANRLNDIFKISGF